MTDILSELERLEPKLEKVFRELEIARQAVKLLYDHEALFVRHTYDGFEQVNDSISRFICNCKVCLVLREYEEVTGGN